MRAHFITILRGRWPLRALSCLSEWTTFLDMRRNAYLIYLICQGLVIVLVTASFKTIADRQVAATVAGTLFVVVPVVLMLLEYRRARFQEAIWYVSVLQFWLLFALPILGLRLLNWGIPFDQLSFLGIPGPTMHQWSSKSYMIMTAFTAWTLWKLKYFKKSI